MQLQSGLSEPGAAEQDQQDGGSRTGQDRTAAGLFLPAKWRDRVLDAGAGLGDSSVHLGQSQPSLFFADLMQILATTRRTAISVFCRLNADLGYYKAGSHRCFLQTECRSWLLQGGQPSLFFAD